MELFAGEKGLWSVAEEALLPRVAREGLSGRRLDSFCGGFA